jgi:hypothetical protein
LLTPPLRALGFQIDSRTFIMLVKYRMGLPLAAAVAPCTYSTGTLDIYGIHAASCSGKFGLSYRHNRVRDCIKAQARRAGMRATDEEPRLLTNDPTLRPADVYIAEWHLSRGMCLDVSIVNPLTDTAVVAASTTPASAAAHAEKHKMARYHKLCADSGHEFSPVVMETYGGFGELARPILKRISKALSTCTDQDESDALNTLCNNISFACQKALGEALTSRYPLFLCD